MKKSNKIQQKPKGLKAKKKLMIEAIIRQLGIVSSAAKQVGINNSTHYEWLKKDKVYKKAVEESEFILKDFGENALFKLISSGNPQSVIFFNKTRNRDRGYSESIKIEHSGKIETLTKDERETEIRRLLKK